MIVRVNFDKGKHVNFYEGSHVGFHPKGVKWEDGVTIVVEGRKDSVTIEVDKKSDTQIFLMNDQGKTIEKIFV